MSSMAADFSIKSPYLLPGATPEMPTQVLIEKMARDAVDRVMESWRNREHQGMGAAPNPTAQAQAAAAASTAPGSAPTRPLFGRAAKVLSAGGKAVSDDLMAGGELLASGLTSTAHIAGKGAQLLVDGVLVSGEMLGEAGKALSDDMRQGGKWLAEGADKIADMAVKLLDFFRRLIAKIIATITGRQAVAEAPPEEVLKVQDPSEKNESSAFAGDEPAADKPVSSPVVAKLGVDAALNFINELISDNKWTESMALLATEKDPSEFLKFFGEKTASIEERFRAQSEAEEMQTEAYESALKQFETPAMSATQMRRYLALGEEAQAMVPQEVVEKMSKLRQLAASRLELAAHLHGFVDAARGFDSGIPAAALDEILVQYPLTQAALAKHDLEAGKRSASVYAKPFCPTAWSRAVEPGRSSQRAACLRCCSSPDLWKWAHTGPPGGASIGRSGGFRWRRPAFHASG